MEILRHKNRGPTLYVNAIIINLGHSYTTLCLWLDICLNGLWGQCYLWSENLDTGSGRLICCPKILGLEFWLWRKTWKYKMWCLIQLEGYQPWYQTVNFIYMLRQLFQFSSVQSLSRVRLFVTPWIAARQASLSITNSQSYLVKFTVHFAFAVCHQLLPFFFLKHFPDTVIICRHLSKEPSLPILRTYDLGGAGYNGAVLELGPARIHCPPGQRDSFREKWPSKPDHWDPEGQTWELVLKLSTETLSPREGQLWGRCKSETAGGPFCLCTQGTCQCRQRQSPGQTDRGRSTAFSQRLGRSLIPSILESWTS